MKTLQEIAESLEKKGFRKEAHLVRTASQKHLKRIAKNKAKWTFRLVRNAKQQAVISITVPDNWSESDAEDAAWKEANKSPRVWKNMFIEEDTSKTIDVKSANVLNG